MPASLSMMARRARRQWDVLSNRLLCVFTDQSSQKQWPACCPRSSPPRRSWRSSAAASCRRRLSRSMRRATCARRPCPPALPRSPQHLPTGTSPPLFFSQICSPLYHPVLPRLSVSLPLAHLHPSTDSMVEPRCSPPVRCRPSPRTSTPPRPTTARPTLPIHQSTPSLLVFLPRILMTATL